MSSTSIKIPQQKADDESHVQQNESTTDLEETSNKNVTKESENEKPQNAEVVLDIDETTQESAKLGSNKDFLVYQYQDGEKNPWWRTPVVYFGVIDREESAPMEYTSDRNGFVRLVLLLVFIMLAVTALVISLVFMIDDLKEYCREHQLLIGISGLILVMATNYSMFCSACTRVCPCNIIWLCIGVVGMSLTCICVTVYFKTEIVLMAAAATAGVVFVCFLFAFSKFDFTAWILYIVVFAAAFAIVSLIFCIYTMVTGHYMKIAHLVILLVGTLLSSVILIMELQMILGGKSVELSEQDYALGAFMVYSAIISLFLRILQIIGLFDSGFD